MALLLEPHDTIAAAARRVAYERLEDALALLRGGADPDEVVHEARKRFKELRGLLRLLRAALGDEVYRRENVALRDAGRGISDLRDAQVLIDTLDRAVEGRSEADEPAVAAVRSALTARHEALRERQLGDADRFGRVADAVDEVRARVAGWSFERSGWEALEPGLRRIYRRGRSAMRRAYRRPSAERFHAWRKEVKYLRYQSEWLAPLWPETVEAQAAALDALGDLLGDDHDASVLRAALLAEPEAFGGAEVVALLAARLTEWSGELRRRARPVGLRVHAEKPAPFVTRFGGYWRAWRDEQGDA